MLLLMPRLNHKAVYGQILPLPVTVDYTVTQITPEEVFVLFSRADAKGSQCFRSGVAVEVGGVVELEDTIRLYISTLACTSQFVWTACYRFQENIVPLIPALETARPRLRACIWSTPVQKAWVSLCMRLNLFRNGCMTHIIPTTPADSRPFVHGRRGAGGWGLID